MTAPASQPGPVILSLGLGVESSAILARYVLEGPEACGFDLTNGFVFTAVVGDEFPDTHDTIERALLPLMRRAGVRWIQASRRSSRQADGIEILHDSRDPHRSIRHGRWRLSTDLTTSGVIVATSGNRTCSQKAKGWVAAQVSDQILGPTTAHTVLLGFNRDETTRAARAQRFDTPTRRTRFPLLEWGWTREDCERYLLQHTGHRFRRSACVACPYGLTNRAALPATLARMNSQPQAAVTALLLEQRAVAINPRQGLIAGRRLLTAARELPADALLACYQQRLERDPWALYEVRRIWYPARGDRARPLVARSVTVRQTGPQKELSAALATHGNVEHQDEIPRVWLQRRAPGGGPGREHFLTVALAGATDKEPARFQQLWTTSTPTDSQLPLPTTLTEGDR